MRKRAFGCWLMLVGLVLANVGVEQGFAPVTVVGQDPSARHCATTVSYDGRKWQLMEGEQIKLQPTSSSPISVQKRGEVGWDHHPITPVKRLRLRWQQRAYKPEQTFAFAGLAAIAPSRRRNCRILLASPPLLERTYPGRSPIGYLSAYLRAAGFPVATVDVDIIGRAKFREVVKGFDPQIVGVTSLSVQIDQAISLIRIAKALAPNAVTVLGGNHATQAWPYLTVHSSYLDVAVVGEGMHPLLQIAEAVDCGRWERRRGKIAGLVLFSRDSAVPTPVPKTTVSVDEYLPDLPYDPAYNFAVFREPDGRWRRTAQCMTAIGCSNACFFCESSVNARGGELRQERRMSLPQADRLLAQMAGLGYEAVYFDDDTFTRDREHALAVARMCKRYGMVFGCHTRPDCEDEALIREFVACGCRYMFAGMESAVPAILRGANKTHDPEDYKDAYRQSYNLKRTLGLSASAFMIHGMPRLENGQFSVDTLDDSRASLEFAIRELDPAYLSMNVLRFLPGVPFSQAKQFAFLRPVEGPLHGGYFDRIWMQVNGKRDPRCKHPIMRAFEGSGSPVPVHMTPLRCYQVLQIAVELVNGKNAEPGRQQTSIVVDPWFEEQRFLVAKTTGGTLQYELAPWEAVDQD